MQTRAPHNILTVAQNSTLTTNIQHLSNCFLISILPHYKPLNLAPNPIQLTSTWPEYLPQVSSTFQQILAFFLIFFLLQLRICILYLVKDRIHYTVECHRNCWGSVGFILHVSHGHPRPINGPLCVYLSTDASFTAFDHSRRLTEWEQIRTWRRRRGQDRWTGRER